MAKIKFPLKMKNDAQVRTLEELREHFDLAAVLGYFDDGRLVEWLESRHYDDEVKKIKVLVSSADDFKRDLCDILGVCYSENEVDDIDFIDISSRNERRERLKRFTADDKILAAVDNVVFSQEELEDYLNKYRVPIVELRGTAPTPLGNEFRCMIKGMDVIYLCGERFIIPPDLHGEKFVGVNNPHVEAPAGFSNRHITFEKVSLDLDVEDIIQCAKEATDLGEALKYWRMAAEQDNAEAQYQIGIAPFVGASAIDFNASHKEAFKWLLKAAEQGHIEAQLAVARTYVHEGIIDNNYEEAATWLLKVVLLAPNVENAENYLDNVFNDYDEYNLNEIVHRIRTFAAEGSSVAQFVIGFCYYFNYHHSLGWSKEESQEDWFRKAADQGYDKAISKLQKIE